METTSFNVNRPISFTVIDNGIFFQKNLSAKAIGLYCLICSKANCKKWNFTIAGMASLVSDGVDSVRSGINELRKAGLLKWEVVSYGRGTKVNVTLNNLPSVESSENESKSDSESEITILSSEEEKSITERSRGQKQKISKDVTEDSLRLAKKLADSITHNFPYKNPQEKDIQNWADSIGKINRLDKKDWREIEAVLDWCQQDSFWYKNILSGDKFRKQYDRLYDQAYVQFKEKQNKIAII